MKERETMNKERAYNRNLAKYKVRMISQANLALDDDVGSGDITTQALIRDVARLEDAVIIAKATGILCGLQEAEAVLEEGGLDFKGYKKEGDVIKKGEVIAKVRGNVKEIVMRERTALDYLQVLSGIATATHHLARRFPGRVAGLRKTHPGLCYSEKRAIQAGGGFSHRLGLYDGFLIKDNHLAAIIRELYGDDDATEEKKIMAIREALKRAKEYRLSHNLEDCFIEVEVESLAQALVAAKIHRVEGVPDMILLDNMTPQNVTQCVKAIRREAGEGILIESSGGVTSKNIRAYVEAGVDIVSTSQITLAAKPLDISMKIIGYK
ncbi:MAG: hypothetical protein QG670_807 [Thermoproteota archaeon]|nr:hypothetical protein [Thermoproteota archaeon]